MGDIDPGENHIRSVVLFQVMRNLVEGSARVRGPRTGAGTRAAGMRRMPGRSKPKLRVTVMVKVEDTTFSRTGRWHVV